MVAQRESKNGGMMPPFLPTNKPCETGRFAIISQNPFPGTLAPMAPAAVPFPTIFSETRKIARKETGIDESHCLMLA